MPFDLKIYGTFIKNLLREGKIKDANSFLVRNYYIKGEVVEGEKRGREIGFPTTNLKTNWNFLPKEGVYVTHIYVKGVKHEGITNYTIGQRKGIGIGGHSKPLYVIEIKCSHRLNMFCLFQKRYVTFITINKTNI